MGIRGRTISEDSSGHWWYIRPEIFIKTRGEGGEKRHHTRGIINGCRNSGPTICDNFGDRHIQKFMELANGEGILIVEEDIKEGLSEGGS